MTAFPDRLPDSRVPDPRSAPTLRWGILGTGWIADKFVQALQENTTQSVIAVGSRSSTSAIGFASRFSIPHAHASYAALVNDPEIDIVYVSTPHHLHVEHGLLAMAAGKHTLIEKPIALSSVDLERLFRAADQHGVMCQEAFWSFFLPKFDVIRQVIDSGVLGEIQTILADHGELLPPPHRIHDPELAGGSLHDLGVYDFALSAWLVGCPESVVALANWTPAGLVGDAAAVLRSAGGTISSLSTTMLTTTPCRAVIAGTDATLVTDDGFFFPGGFEVRDHRSSKVLRYDQPNTRHGALFWEAVDVARRIAAGDLATMCWTRENTRDTTATLDAVNRQLGLV